MLSPWLTEIRCWIRNDEPEIIQCDNLLIIYVLYVGILGDVTVCFARYRDGGRVPQERHQPGDRQDGEAQWGGDVPRDAMPLTLNCKSRISKGWSSTLRVGSG